eukprot:5134108-Prymnesium_polylepis.1
MAPSHKTSILDQAILGSTPTRWNTSQGRICTLSANAGNTRPTANWEGYRQPFEPQCYTPTCFHSIVCVRRPFTTWHTKSRRAPPARWTVRRSLRSASEGAPHEFHTVIAKAELSTALLGEEGVAAANANCTPKAAQIFVEMFSGGDSFKTFAARTRVRSGMTGIDGAWCNDNPLSCGTIQRALERAPVGATRTHATTLDCFLTLTPVHAGPPPNPTPPPGLNYGQAPPNPTPPPISPPPFYEGSENCLPLPTLSAFGLDTGREAIANAHSEERASCLFVRRILDTMRQASHCFSSVSQPSPPPPPPNNDVKSANDAIKRNIDRQSGRGGE